MLVQLHVTKGNRSFLIDCEEGSPVGPALRCAGLLPMPCGVGKCGKCRIHADTEPSEEEVRLLGEDKIADGIRLACHTRACKGLSISIPDDSGVHVLTSFQANEFEFEPVLTRKPIKTKLASIEDQRSDLRRIMDVTGASSHELNLDELRKLPTILTGAASFDALLLNNKVLHAFAPSEHSHAFIADIGTTTVAGFLADISLGHIIGVRGETNRQSAYGADVISRISREMEWRMSESEYENPLRNSILSQINSMLDSLLSEHDIHDVDCIAIVGNTTMIHFLLDLPSERISRSPFIPVSVEALRVPAESVGINSRAFLWIPPALSAYIGSDITASLLAAGAHHPHKPFLLVDFGTNAETVLHTGKDMLACSAAAGPCFEGASLSCGMAGANGAIDRVYINERGQLGCSVIGGCESTGICGTGALDAIAVFLNSGLVDETGKLDCNAPDYHVDKDSIYLSKNVYVTQKDIREIQLAKAAVRAGMEILLGKSGLEWKDIDTFYVAGGFGSAINPESAVRTGLIPGELASRTRVLGNAAAFGAYRYVTEKNAVEMAEKMLSSIHYVELSADSDFSTAYVEQMFFPDMESCR